LTKKPEIKAQAKKTFKFPLYIVLYVVIALIGLLEAGPMGFVVGLASAILCSLITLVGLVPFAGIPLYWYIANGINGLLGTLGYNIPVAMAVGFTAFLILAIITNLFMSFVAGLIILKLILGD